MQPISDAVSTTGGERDSVGDCEDLSRPRPSVTVRRVLVTMCWLGIAVTAFVCPRLLWMWPVTGLAFLVIVLGSVAELGPAFACKEPPSHLRFHILISRAALVLLAGCSIVGAITSAVPSMAYRSKGGDILYEYGLSILVAPTLWAAILGTSMSAIMVPSPRRLALASGAGLVGWPLFVAIRVLREPLFDLDNQFALLAPWIVQLYVVAASVASGLAVALTFGAARLAAEPVMDLPPKAFVVSQAEHHRGEAERS
jgi:hypothetical protein